MMRIVSRVLDIYLIQLLPELEFIVVELAKPLYIQEHQRTHADTITLDR
jgi:hypothetical protein